MIRSYDKKDSSEDGQIVIILALLMPFFALLISMVVNLSMIVHQKIRLQNSVDAGVYSAAASMARDLNDIAFLNLNVHVLYESEGGNPMSTNDPLLYEELQEGSLREINDDTAFAGELGAIMQIEDYEQSYYRLWNKSQDINQAALQNAYDYGRAAALLTFYNGDVELAEVNPNQVKFRSHGIYSDSDGDMMLLEDYWSEEEAGYVRLFGSANPFDGNERYEDYRDTVGIPFSKVTKTVFVGSLTGNLGFQMRAPNDLRVPERFYNNSQLRTTVVAAGQPYGGSVERYLSDNMDVEAMARGEYRAALISLSDLDSGMYDFTSVTPGIVSNEEGNEDRVEEVMEIIKDAYFYH